VTYASTAARCSLVVMRATIGCSGATTMYVAPNSVSGRVVNTVSVASGPSTSASLKSASAPSERPIQWRCMSSTLADHSSSSRSVSSRSAYAVMRSIHWRIGRRTTV
jgi:hypothetical protein